MLIQFTSVEAAQTWYDDPDYVAARLLRFDFTGEIHFSATVRIGWRPCGDTPESASVKPNLRVQSRLALGVAMLPRTVLLSMLSGPALAAVYPVEVVAINGQSTATFAPAFTWSGPLPDMPIVGLPDTPKVYDDGSISYVAVFSGSLTCAIYNDIIMEVDGTGTPVGSVNVNNAGTVAFTYGAPGIPSSAPDVGLFLSSSPEARYARGESAPGFAGGAAITQVNGLNVDQTGGAAFHLGSDSMGGRNTDQTALYYLPEDAHVPSTLVKTGDTFGALPVAEVSNVWAVSDDGEHWAAAGLLDDPNVQQDGILVVDGSVVLRENVTASSGSDFFEGFDHVDINDLGGVVVAGATSGAAAVEHYVAYDGVVLVRQGDTVDGVTLPVDTEVESVSTNNLGQVLHQWRGVGLFLTCDPTDPAGTTKLLLTPSDGLDIDRDGVADLDARVIPNDGMLTDDLEVVLLTSTVTTDSAGNPVERRAIAKYKAACCPDADVDGVCDADDRCAGDDGSGDADADGICNDVDFVLTNDLPVAGQPMTLRVDNAAPGATVGFAGSINGPGGEPCMGAVCGGLSQPVFLGTATAGTDGVASLEVVVPASLAGTRVYLQALVDDAGQSDVTNVVLRNVR